MKRINPEVILITLLTHEKHVGDMHARRKLNAKKRDEFSKQFDSELEQESVSKFNLHLHFYLLKHRKTN